MEKKDFIKKIAEDSDVDYKTAKKVVENLEELVLDIIAMNDKISFKFAVIGGYEKEPKKITGYYSVLKKVEKRHGWSVAKGGTPFCEFTKEANYYQPIDPVEFFSRVDQKYKTKARQFRKDYGIPEISEYEGLSEEQIESLCEKADTLGMTDSEKKLYYKRRKNRNHSLANSSLVQLDLKKQLDSGIPKDQLKIRDKEEIIKDLQKEWKKNQNREKKRDWDPDQETFIDFYFKKTKEINDDYKEIMENPFFIEILGEQYYNSDIVKNLQEFKKKEEERIKQNYIEKRRIINARKEKKAK